MSRHERSVSSGSLPTTHRYSTPHANSSAFSASANPNEDWTKISDLAERRRIQNRIAQRNYRKKLKRRLEDLERRAASTSASPEPEDQPRREQNPPARRAVAQRPPLTTRATTGSTSFPYEQSPEPSYGPRSSEHDSYMPVPDDRHLMNRSPPTFSYSSFGTPDTVAGPYPVSPALSSYSVPSPSLSGPSTGYSNASSYLSPRIATSSATSPTDSADLQKGYFDQEYGSAYAGYGYGAVGSYPLDSNTAYSLAPFLFEARSPFDAYGNVDSPRHLWTTLAESPPLLRL